MAISEPPGRCRIHRITTVCNLWGASDDPAGPVEAKVVEEVFVRVAPVVNLHVDGRIIRTTAEHPFFVLDRGWIPVGHLRPGDPLVDVEGRPVPVEQVAETGEVTTVYNLRVADFHTYFVGSRAEAWSLWAHNYTPKNYVLEQVPNGDTPGMRMALMAAWYRLKKGLAWAVQGKGAVPSNAMARNVGVMTFTVDGKTYTWVVRSRTGGKVNHSEQRLLTKLEEFLKDPANEGKKISNLTIYTERTPCTTLSKTKGQTRCAKYINDFIKKHGEQIDEIPGHPGKKVLVYYDVKHVKNKSNTLKDQVAERVNQLREAHRGSHGKVKDAAKAAENARGVHKDEDLMKLDEDMINDILEGAKFNP